MVRYSFFIGVTFLLAACATSSTTPATGEPTRVVGTLRYTQDQRLLQTTLQIETEAELSETSAPSVMGSAMRAATAGGAGLYTDRRQVALPPKVDLTVPCQEDVCLLSLELPIASVDSLPATMSRTEAQRLRIGQAPLGQGESVILFFEPTAGGAPRRLQFMGPTTTAVLGLPAESLADVPAGNYSFYLVRQGVVKDSTAALVHKIQTEYFTRPRPLQVVD